MKQLIKKYFARTIYAGRLQQAEKTALEQHVHNCRHFSEASFDIFTDQGEDGIIRFLLDNISTQPKTFVDIGSGDCIKSNCATLVIHYGWTGRFIDVNKRKLEIGRRFYDGFAGISFLETEVHPSNVNDILKDVDIGVLSIDIDGNDFWIWKAIDGINPGVIVIESKVEFGKGNFVVPFAATNLRSVDLKYNGASVQALIILGRQKGYKLVAANRYGYNLFFVREDEALPEIGIDEVLSNPETRASIYPEPFFTSHIFEKA